MKRFHISGTVEASWSMIVDAETEEEAQEIAYERAIENTDCILSYSVESTDEEEGVFEEV